MGLNSSLVLSKMSMIVCASVSISNVKSDGILHLVLRMTKNKKTEGKGLTNI